MKLNEKQAPIPLNERQRQVIDHYMIHLNKTEAMLAAGYSPSTAQKLQHSVFGRREVQEEIERRQKKMSEEAQVTAQWVIQKYKDIVEADLGDLLVIQEDGSAYYDLTRATPQHLASLGEYTVDEIQEGRGSGAKIVKRIRIKLQDKLRALDALARHLGLFNDKVEVRGQIDLIDRINSGRMRMNEDV